MKHVILDTDIGGDPDDTFALLLALNSPELSIDLIVTSDEHKGHRASFTRALLKSLGHNVTVVKGADLGHDKCCVVDDIARESPDDDYVSAMKDVIDKYNNVHYVCISPQTNLAGLLHTYPEVAPKLDITIMGGALKYRKPGPEHNIKYDIASARSVFESNTRKLYVVSDTTFKPELEVNEQHWLYQRLDRSEHPARHLLVRSMQNFFKKLHKSTIMHDPLTLSGLIDNTILTYEPKKLRIGLDGVMREDAKGEITFVSSHANYDKFWKLMEERVRL